MKIKFLIIAICCTSLLFTSCEKDEMGVGGGTGGGMQNKNNTAKTTLIEKETTFISNTTSTANE